jgi:hypothetical protein
VSDPFCAKHPKGRFPAKGGGHLFSAQPLGTAYPIANRYLVLEIAVIGRYPEGQSTAFCSQFFSMDFPLSFAIDP